MNETVTSLPFLLEIGLYFSLTLQVVLAVAFIIVLLAVVGYRCADYCSQFRFCVRLPSPYTVVPVQSQGIQLASAPPFYQQQQP